MTDSGIKACSVCGKEYDVESEESENPGMCFVCEDYLDCCHCGVELCKPSECPDGCRFGCSSCGVNQRRRGSRMVVEGGPDDRAFESEHLNNVLEGEKRITRALHDIKEERHRQNEKWKREPGEWVSHPFVKLGVLAEEFGEVARALLERSPIAHLKKELIQVAAVAAAWAEDCDSGMETKLHMGVSNREDEIRVLARDLLALCKKGPDHASSSDVLLENGLQRIIELVSAKQGDPKG